MKTFLTILGLSLATSAWAAGEKAAATKDNANLKIPISSQQEHKELREAVERAVSSGGKTAEIAKRLSAVMESHFVKEERYVMPLLSLLGPLSKNVAPANGGEAIKLADTLRKELPAMLSEHKDVASLLIDLKAAALKEGKGEFVTFADDLSRHAGQEEEILYPAALVVGEYLKTRNKAL